MYGPFKSFHGWSDGNHFFVNYVGHPLQGAVTGFILIHNDPKGKDLRFGRQRAYWVSRAKAMGYAAAYSLYWELGFPLSEAAIGNLGPDGRPGLAAVDLVITPNRRNRISCCGRRLGPICSACGGKKVVSSGRKRRDAQRFEPQPLVFQSPALEIPLVSRYTRRAQELRQLALAGSLPSN